LVAVVSKTGKNYLKASGDSIFSGGAANITCSHVFVDPGITNPNLKLCSKCSEEDVQIKYLFTKTLGKV
jgi:hypothetical protein